MPKKTKKSGDTIFSRTQRAAAHDRLRARVIAALDLAPEDRTSRLTRYVMSTGEFLRELHGENPTLAAELKEEQSKITFGEMDAELPRARLVNMATGELMSGYPTARLEAALRKRGDTDMPLIFAIAVKDVLKARADWDLLPSREIEDAHERGDTIREVDLWSAEAYPEAD